MENAKCWEPFKIPSLMIHFSLCISTFLFSLVHNSIQSPYSVSVTQQFQCQALVLRTYDTGEADRFCILLTREQGRVTATATGARKIGSRLGGFLLPFRHVTLQLRESRSGFYVSGATPADPPLTDIMDVRSFAQAQEGMEFLLSLVSHEEPDPDVFDATLAFLSACRTPAPEGVPAFQIRLLHLLGLLPDDHALQNVMSLSREEQAFVTSAREGSATSPLQRQGIARIRELCLRCSADHLTGALKSPSVVASL